MMLNLYGVIDQKMSGLTQVIPPNLYSSPTQNLILNSTQPFPEPTQLKRRIVAGITSTRFSDKAVCPGKVPDFDRQPPSKITPFDAAQHSASNTTKMKFNTTI
ncbi:unnamed protein product [Rotaria socialis]|uniref:Uncharacterized protein n=2 Tax=Rotaria socialis TaxID=392032 RepID=A0A820H0U8_9BILA|nr:unnamed protein product [Rotaria socialis]